jgi:hypothetical protein
MSGKSNFGTTKSLGNDCAYLDFPDERLKYQELTVGFKRMAKKNIQISGEFVGVSGWFQLVFQFGHSRHIPYARK